MSKQYWIHQTSVFVITSNRLIFQAHFYKALVCFHKFWTLLQFLGFLQLSASVTLFLKVKMKDSFVAGLPSPPVHPALFTGTAPVIWAGPGRGVRVRILTGLHASCIWEQKQSPPWKPLIPVYRADLCPGGPPAVLRPGRVVTSRNETEAEMWTRHPPASRPPACRILLHRESCLTLLKLLFVGFCSCS